MAAANLNHVLQLPAHAIEGIANGDINIFMRGILFRFGVDKDIAARDMHTHLHVKHDALMTMPVRHRYDHVAAHDTIEEAFELFRVTPNRVGNKIGFVHISKLNLQWELHSS